MYDPSHSDVRSGDFSPQAVPVVAATSVSISRLVAKPITSRGRSASGDVAGSRRSLLAGDHGADQVLPVAE